MEKTRRLTLFKSVVNLIARSASIRPIVAAGLLLIVVVGIYVKSPLYGYEKPVYLEGEDNYFTSSGYDNGDTITLTGHISAISSKESGGKTVLSVTISRIRTETDLLLTGPFEKVSAYFPEGTQLNIGQNISLRGSLSFFSHASNPGEFDYYDYEKYRGVLFAVYDCELLGAADRYSRLAMWLYDMRLKGEEILVRFLATDDAAIMKAMLFGNKNEIPDETKELFQKNGIAHILAISGLHISFLAMALYGLMRKMGIKQVICMGICSVLIIMYGIMVGLPTSAFRAICMFLIFLLSKTILRTYDLMSALFFAMILLLLFKPGLIMDTGFGLSFSAVFSVGYLYNSFRNNVWQCPDYLNSVFVSLFIFIGTLPVILSSYYEVAFYSILLNLVIIPLMSVLLVAGIGLVAAGYLCAGSSAGVAVGSGVVVSAGHSAAANIASGAAVSAGHSAAANIASGAAVSAGVGLLPQLSARVVTWILWLYKNTCALLTTLQNGRFNLGKPSVWQVIIYCLLVLLAVNMKREYVRTLVKMLLEKANAGEVRDAASGKRTKVLRDKYGHIAISALILILALVTISVHTHRGITIYQMDIGQGDCQIIINDNGHAYMVDGGSSSVKNVGDRRVVPLLKWAGVNEIDIFLSHPDEDHMNAIMELMENQVKEHIKVNHLYIFEGFVENADTAGSNLGYAGINSAGMDFSDVGSAGSNSKGMNPSGLDTAGMDFADVGSAGSNSIGMNPEVMASIGMDFSDESSVLALARELGVRVVGLKAGDRLEDGELKIEVIYPSKGYPVSDTNNASMVLKVSYGHFSMIDTGDVEIGGEKIMLARMGALADGTQSGVDGKENDIDVLKVAHHGSSSSSSEEFLRALSPNVAIISAGKKNKYGHPHKATMERLHELGIRTVRTDETGCIIIEVSRNGDYRVKGFCASGG